MYAKRYSRLAAATLGFALSTAAFAQEAPTPETVAPTAPPVDIAPAPTPAPTTTPPVVVAPPPAPTAPLSTTETAPAVAAPATTPAPQPEITVTEHGDWEIGCLDGTPQCELQQVAVDETGNPVVLVRIVRLPEGADAQALAVFNTPLGTLLPPGLGFQIDSAQTAQLPFEWCVQEGCVVRLGLREPDVAAMKRGSRVNMTVTSIADPTTPVTLTLSLTGFTAGYAALPVPTAPPAPEAAPAQ